ncbi:MAG: hypothetical protein PHG54_00670 [Smithellaceae bacterium]|nr:hypothetical protein [Syntrophaceae bacterium]MDD4239923.1 hypothetical protein [Smithellaceae bacterium]NLX51586.1 hypothetical protein [Deltaproteobacteria bacterium]
MPNVSAEVTSYQYEFRTMNGENAAFLYLFNAQNTLLCMAAFVERTGALPGPRQGLNGTVFLSFHRSDLSSVTDMLRNEKPVMFNWSAENQSAQITTGKEPVGEEENRHIAAIFAAGKPATPKRARKSAATKKTKK